MYSTSSRMKKILVILLAFTLIFSFNMAFADTQTMEFQIASSGSIFTTDSSGTVVNENTKYNLKNDVWVKGSGFPTNDNLWIKVTNPNGDGLGISSSAVIPVSGGNFGPINLSVAVGGYAFSSTGVYKVWVSDNDRFEGSKTDNFKVEERAIIEEAGSIEITKTWEFGDSEETSGPDVTFKLTGDNEFEEQNILLSGEETITFSNLAPGSYTLNEVVPEGYSTNLNGGNNDLVVAVTSNAVTSVTVSNTILDDTETGIKIIKTQRIGEEGTKTPHPGITFYLDSETFGEPLSGITDENGILEFYDLEPGFYIVTEEDSDEYTTSLVEDGGENEFRVVEDQVTVVNVINTYTYSYGSIKIVKTNNSGAPHSGVTFTLDLLVEEVGYQTVLVEEEPEFPLSGQTGSDGILIFNNLEPATYILNEVVPANYTSNLPVDREVVVEVGPPTVVNVINTYSGGSGGDDNGGGSYDDGGGSVVVPEEEEVLAPPEEEVVEEVVPEVEVPLPKTGGNPAAYPLFGSVLAGLGMYLRRSL